MIDPTAVLTDCDTADADWAKVISGLYGSEWRAAVALLASRAKPLADAARELLAENSRLRAALEPFAALAADLDAERVLFPAADDEPVTRLFAAPTVGDCRRAAELLAEEPPEDTDMDAVQLIALERARQRIGKGYTPEHDDEHRNGSLLHAGVLLALDVAGHELKGCDPPNLSGPWPDALCLAVREKHAGDDVRRLTIAGAMICAEIDRLIRERDRQPKGTHAPDRDHDRPPAEPTGDAVPR